MCGIAGATDPETVEVLVQHLQHRGSSTSTHSDGFAMGHVLHPIVGHVEQPLVGDGVLVANCEIYNWHDLCNAYGIKADNDADLLLQLLDHEEVDVLEQLDGVYAFAYRYDGELILARDVLGVKPLWYAVTDDGLVFSSERQALEHAGFAPQELHPRQLLRYDLIEQRCTFEQRDFFSINNNEELGLDRLADEVADLFLQAVEKRIPDGPVGLLFSGGVDSTMVAAALQRLDVEFTCYTAGIHHGNVNAPKDVDWARRVADTMNLELQVYEATLDEVETLLPDITDWISSTSVVKTGVALPFHLALQQGEEPVVFSGLGSEQLYAGYDRYEGYINKECLSGLRSLFHRDLYRDDVIAMRNGFELRLPFLDPDLVTHALTIPGEYKVQEGYRKYVLRKAAEQLGVPDDVVWRKKTAAQYGSNFDKALGRLAKDAGAASKQAYLNTFYEKPNHRLAALFSGGKDSSAAVYRMARRNNKICCLLNLQSENQHSYMFDTKQAALIEQQAESLGTPLLTQHTAGEKEKELTDLQAALAQAKQEYGVDGVVAGALASTYQRDRVEAVAERVGLAVFAPLWQEDPEQYMRWLVREGFQVQITRVAAQGLGDEWEGTVLDEERVEDLIHLAETHRFNAAGEGGEYETLVTRFPDTLHELLEKHGQQEPDQD